MRIAVVWDWEPEYEQSITWSDGLAAALKELSGRHELKVFSQAIKGEPCLIPNPYVPIHSVDNITYQVQQFKPDVILVWADRGRPNIKPLSELEIPMAMCFSGGSTEDGEFHRFQHIFVENDCYKKQLERFPSVSVAFGTNTDLYTPLPDQQKVIDILFPATFAMWKRHRLFSDVVRELDLSSCAVGYMQPEHEKECWQDCEKAGCLVLPHVSGKALHRLYAASKVVVITSNNDGGSQRTVLEAMAMNIPVIVNEESEKNTEYPVIKVPPEARTIQAAILQALVTPVQSRDYILRNWSHKIYANELETKLYEISNRS